jgi:hypothetical protein
MIKEGYNYSYTLSEPVTQTFKPGTYPGYIQFINRRQDVFYNKSSISLESPYAAVKSVKVIGMLPPLVKTEFDKLESNTLYTDDTLVSITMELKTPDIQITNYYESNDHIYVRGTSSASEGTNISLVLDPAYSSTTSPALSYTTKLYGTIDKPREYYGIIPVNWNKLSIGTHTLVASIQSSGMKASQQKTVEVTPLHENTAPVINTTAKEIIGDGGWQRIVATNGTVYLQSPNGTLYLIPAPTPITVYVTQPSQTPQIVYVNVTVPQTPTPVPVPTDDIVIPLHPEIAGLAIVIVGAVFVLRRG